jgi:hypothetical protein
MRTDDFDPFATAFILDRPPLPQLSAGGGSAAVEGKANGYIKVAANADAPALLVLSEAYHWNWIALVNGRETKPIVVNGALLGVAVPAGASTVELSYRPIDLYAGAAISGATLIMLVVIAIVPLVHRRRNDRIRSPELIEGSKDGRPYTSSVDR